MKTPSTVKLALFMATLSLPSISSAVQGYMANIKLALTVSETVFTTYQRDEDGNFVLDENDERIPYPFSIYSTDGGLTKIQEQGSKVVTRRYGNRELLEDLYDQGAFPEAVTSIKGWFLKQVSAESTNRTYLYAKDQTPVDVTSALSIMFNPTAVKGTAKITAEYDEPEGDIVSVKGGGSSSFKGMVLVSIGGEDFGIAAQQIYGKGTGSVRYKVKGTNPIPAAALNMRITGLIGAEQGGGFLPGLVEGSGSFSGAVALDDVQTVFSDFEIDDN